MKLYWFRFDAPGLPVTMPALRTKHFRWRGLYGLQIGPWFFGVVNGQPGEPWSDPDASTPTSTSTVEATPHPDRPSAIKESENA